MDEPRVDAVPGLAMPLVWVGLALLVSLLSCAGLGFAVADSESAGVTAANIVAFPLCFVLSGAFVAPIVHFAVRKASPVRVAVPLGCGCLGGLAGLVSLVFFFGAIFPAL